jgi:phospholipid/cholesterol/gamma-HCH transport system substrate-binding protein
MSKEQEMVAFFSEVDALAAGDPVFIYGVRRGRVMKVEFSEGFTEPTTPPEKRLFVVFKLDHPVTLRKNYTIEVGSPNFLGGRQLDVTLGDGEPIPASEYHDLRGRSSASMVKQLSGLLGDNRENVKRFVQHLSNLAEDIDTGKRTGAQVILGTTSSNNLDVAIAAGMDVFTKASGGDGSIGRALNSPELHDRFVGFLANGEKLFTDAKDQPGAINLLVYDQEFANRLRSGMQGLSEFAGRIGRGEGLLGKLSQPESESTWNDVKAIVADTRAGRGALGKLLNDPEVEAAVVNMANKFSGISSDLAVLVDGARRGRGVIGLLMTDDQARRTVERIIDQVARTIEDAREAAPVSSVASFLFGNL